MFFTRALQFWRRRPRMARPVPQAVRDLEKSEALWREEAKKLAVADKGGVGVKSTAPKTPGYFSSSDSPDLTAAARTSPSPPPASLSTVYRLTASTRVKDPLTGAIPPLIHPTAERSGNKYRVEAKERMKKQYARAKEQETGLGKTVNVARSDGSVKKAAIVKDEAKVTAWMKQKKGIVQGEKSKSSPAPALSASAPPIKPPTPRSLSSTKLTFTPAPFPRFASSPRRVPLYKKQQRRPPPPSLGAAPPTPPTLADKAEQSFVLSDNRGAMSVDLGSPSRPAFRAAPVKAVEAVEQGGKVKVYEAKKVDLTRSSSTILSAAAVPATVKSVAPSRSAPIARRAKVPSGTVVGQGRLSKPAASVSSLRNGQDMTSGSGEKLSAVVQMAKKVRPEFFVSGRKGKEGVEVEKAKAVETSTTPQCLPAHPVTTATPALISDPSNLSSLPWSAQRTAYLHTPDLSLSDRRQMYLTFPDLSAKYSEIRLLTSIDNLNRLRVDLERLIAETPLLSQQGLQFVVNARYESLRERFLAPRLPTADASLLLRHGQSSFLFADVLPPDGLVPLFADKACNVPYKSTVEQVFSLYPFTAISKGGTKRLERVERGKRKVVVGLVGEMEMVVELARRAAQAA